MISLDYDTVKAACDNADFPYQKVRITWPSGNTETPWGRTLGDGRVLLCNTPLFPRYQFLDVVTVTPGDGADDVVGLVYRPFPRKVTFQYQTLESEVSDAPRRSRICRAVPESLGHMGFMSCGNGYVLLREGVEPMEVRLALMVSGIPITEMVEVRYTDETGTSYMKVESPRHQPNS